MRNISSIRVIVIFTSIALISLWLAREYFSVKPFQKTIDIQQAPVENSISVETESKEPDAEDEKSASKEGGEKEDAKPADITKDTLEKGSSSQSEKTRAGQDDISEGVSIINQLMQSGFEKKATRTIDTIVIHSSYDALGTDSHSVEGVIKEYEIYGVSAHYLVDRKGKIYQLVEDNDIAWHAGASRMPDGRTNVNQFSIGIELIYTKEEKPDSDQYDALKKLTDNLKNKYSIKNIVGHNQIAPERKNDPWNFDWSKISNH